MGLLGPNRTQVVVVDMPHITLLVGGFKNDFIFHIWVVILPIDLLVGITIQEIGDFNGNMVVKIDEHSGLS